MNASRKSALHPNPVRRSQIRAGLGGAGLSALLGLALWQCPGVGDWFNALSFDLLTLARGSRSVPEVVIVAMDEESHQRLGQPADKLWDRSLHARLVDTLMARGARVVVFDVVFADKWPDPAVDQAFAQALQRASGKVMLAAKLLSFEEEARAAGSRVLHPVEPLASAAPWGVVELALDPGGALRRAPLPVPALAESPLAYKAAELSGIPLPETEDQRWIAYYGPRPFRQISYWQAMEPEKLPPDVFSNKVVFVGQTRVVKARGASAGDEYPTALTRWTSQLSSGVEIQATVFVNLLRHDWLRELPAGAETALFILYGGMFGFGLSLLKPLPALAWAAAGALLTGAGAVVLFRVGHLWFPWLIVAGTQIPFSFGWSALAFVLQAVKQDIPDHELLRCVGRGGYGEVWLARDAIGGFHAVKIVYRKSFRRPERRVRARGLQVQDAPPVGRVPSPGAPEREERGKSEPFEREFRGITNFAPISRSHPGLVQILHVGRNDLRGCFYYVMEPADDAAHGPEIEPASYSPRTMAHEIARRGRLPVAECVQLGMDLTDALDFLHQRRLVHRDIKPANIIFVNGRPKLADAGLVTLGQVAQPSSPASSPGAPPDLHLRTDGGTPPELASGTLALRTITRLGTSGYMAPEGPGFPADLYALGKTLYEAATGCQCDRFPELPTDLSAGSEADALMRLHEILLTACETDPADRYASAAAMRAELVELENSLKAKVSSTTVKAK